MDDEKILKAAEAEEEWVPTIDIDEDTGEIVTPERTFIPGYEKIVAKALGGLVWVAIASILIMLATTLFDVIMRATVSWSMPGVYEYSKFLMVFIAAVAMPYTALNDGHVEVDMLVRRFPPIVRKVLGVINYVVVAAYCVVLMTQNWKQAGVTKIMMLKSPDTPFTLYQYPFYYIISIGIAILLVVVLMKLVNYVRGVN
jgi:TRAP-type C4-dicarboxylate transport system permease small subunit